MVGQSMSSRAISPGHSTMIHAFSDTRSSADFKSVLQLGRFPTAVKRFGRYTQTSAAHDFGGGGVMTMTAKTDVALPSRRITKERPLGEDGQHQPVEGSKSPGGGARTGLPSK
jgi:hypothetical protein